MPLQHQPQPLIRSVIERVGLTSMVQLGLQSNNNAATLLGKLELQNPGGSVKDRVAKYLLSQVNDSIRTLIIPSTGNLAISIATLAAKHQYRIIAIVPERTSNDRIALLKALGAEILRTPNEVRPEAPESAISVATRLANDLPDATILCESNVQEWSAYEEMAEEIVQQTEARVDYVFIGVETGATITGLATWLKRHMTNVKVIGVEPVGSSLAGSDKEGGRRDWCIEDLGSHFKSRVLDDSVVDGWCSVSDKEAYSTARRLVREEGILAGPSSGAVVAAALRYAEEAGAHTTHEFRSVVILNDTALHYTSTLLNDDWLLENDLADDVVTRELEYLSHDRYRAASVEDLQLPAAVTITPTTTIIHALDVMHEREFSQLPVVHATHKKLVGYVSLASLQAQLEQKTAQQQDPVESVMFTFRKSGSGSKYQVITPDTSLATLAKFFETNSFAVITDEQRKWCLGVATKYDLISFLHRRQGY